MFDFSVWIISSEFLMRSASIDFNFFIFLEVTENIDNLDNSGVFPYF